MKLTIEELQHILDIVIQYFRQQNINQISFAAEDFYPQVSRDDLDFDNPSFLKCPPIMLGSLDHDFEVWKNTLSDEDGIYGICGVQISDLGGILTAFGQVSDKLDNPAPLKNTASRQVSPPLLTLNELQEICKLVIRFLEMDGYSEISFEDPRYVKIALKNEYIGMECPPYTIGSLDDCIRTWKDILSGHSAPSALAIDQLGDILTAFGEEIVR